MIWDVAISCWEPIEKVTGGIGTYTRLLLQLLSERGGKDFRVAAFVNAMPSEHLRQAVPNVTFVHVSADATLSEKTINHLGDEHDHYSLHLARMLEQMTATGHLFRTFEFPDYGAESFFTLKSMRAGRVAINALVVRLHSPEMMLVRDNRYYADAVDIFRRQRISRELFCYRHSTFIAYGGDAMLARIESECNRYGFSILQKSIQIQHPYPVDKPLSNSPLLGPERRTSINVGYIGRLETRKGIVEFVETVCRTDGILDIVERKNIYFHLYGRDTINANGTSNKHEISLLLSSKNLNNRFVFHGHLSQNELDAAISRLDGIVYPSLFENYPNALLESLPLGIPTLVSNQGCMPFLSAWSPAVSVYNPLSPDAASRICAFLGTIDGSRLDVRDSYRAIRETVHSGILNSYADLVHNQLRRDDSARDISVPTAFVVPHFNNDDVLAECLGSIRDAMLPSDELIVVDDASMSESRAKAREITARYGGVFIQLKTNGGPARARTVGAGGTVLPFVQFVDADDTIDTEGVRYARSYLERNGDVSMVYGGMQAFGVEDHIWWPSDGSASAIEENYAHSAVLIRRSVFESLGGQDIGLRHHFEDWAFNCKFSLAGYAAETLPVITLNYRVTRSSRTATRPHLVPESIMKVVYSSTFSRRSAPDQTTGELIDLIGVQAGRLRLISFQSGSVYPAKLLRLVERLYYVAFSMKRTFPPGFYVARWIWRRLAL